MKEKNKKNKHKITDYDLLGTIYTERKKIIPVYGMLRGIDLF
jgi:hypothetical protein